VRARERRAILVEGVVQGVGFRPFVHALASRLSLAGFVENRVADVRIEVEGATEDIERFAHDLVAAPPPLARIARVTTRETEPRGDATFLIAPSNALTAGVASIPADCAHCGPRLTIVTRAPYDRAATTMAAFAMCDACKREYDDPNDRRFHAQPVACPACGPTLSASVEEIAQAVERGAIALVKSLGGFHLACDAARSESVRELRRRKARDDKPFAVMVPDLDAATAIAHVSAEERALLASPARPIVLSTKRADARVADQVAPGMARLGLMLPYTPLHHLLMRRLARPLVRTSGNVSDEPMAYEDDDARLRLSPIADVVLTHDRAIHARCDDSIAQVVAGAPVVLRRARGHAPEPLPLPAPLDRPTLALGADLKGAFALGVGRRAVLSHHLGDLAHAEAYRAFAEAIDHYERLLRVRPERLACDLHPDYASVRHALERAAKDGLEVVRVQHHHAHMASCMAEHGLTGAAIGVAFDGTGYGTDGAIWGGEVLVGDAQAVTRAAHLAYVPMPGGEAAVREPWRMALAHLLAAGEDLSLVSARKGRAAASVVAKVSERPSFSPKTSSVGRLFDAVAWLVGAVEDVSFEGQAAMRLEALATDAPRDGQYPFELAQGVLDPRPAIAEIARDVRRGRSARAIARRFHSGLAAATAQACALVAPSPETPVVLSGGVFANAILAAELSEHIERAGRRVHRHERVPPNDGGIALGQLMVVACA
jgi:hydrogenase maturation protein HypF